MIEYDVLGKQFDEIGKTFQGIPHIVIGKDKPVQPSYIKCPYCFNTIQLNMPTPQPVQPIQQVQNNPNPINQPKSSIIDYFKSIGIVKLFLYLCVSLIIGYAVYRLIWG